MFPKVLAGGTPKRNDCLKCAYAYITTGVYRYVIILFHQMWNFDVKIMNGLVAAGFGPTRWGS